MSPSKSKPKHSPSSSSFQRTSTIRPGEIGRLLLSSIQRFQLNRRFIDLRLLHRGKLIAVGHKLIFAAFSRYFDRLLTGSGDGMVDLSLDEHIDRLPALIDFIYGRAVVASGGVVETRRIFDAAEYFGVTSLVKHINLLDLNSCPRPSEPLALIPVAASEQLLVAVQRFRAEGRFLDVRIAFPDEQNLAGHKIVLASTSTHLEALLLSEEASTDPISVLGLDQIESENLKRMPQLMDYLYGLTVKMSIAQIYYFLETARLFGLETEKLNELQKLRERAAQAENQRFLSAKGVTSKTKVQALRKWVSMRQLVLEATHELGNKQTPSSSTSSMLTQRFDAKIIRSAWTSAGTSQSQHRPHHSMTQNIIHSNDITICPRTSNILEPLCLIDPSRLPATSSNSGSLLSPSIPSSLFDDRLMESLLPEIGDAILVSQDQIVDVYENDEGGYSGQMESYNSVGDIASDTGQQFNTPRKRRKPLKTATDQPSGSAYVSVGSEILFECRSCGCQLSTPSEIALHKRNFPDCAIEEEDEWSNECADGTIRTLKTKPRKSDNNMPRMRKMAQNAVIQVTEKHLPVLPETFNCDLCEDYVATSRAYLNEHRKSKHGIRSNGTKAEMVQCAVCSEQFVYRSLLTKHMKSVHEYNKQRNHQCPDCTYCSFDKRGLETHIRIVHKMDRPYRCPHCSDTFAISSHLYRHLRGKHEDLMTDSERKHTQNNHQCSQCGQIFKEKRELTVHTNRDHNDIRPFSCQRCGRAFYRSDHLRVHELRMHGKKSRKKDQ